MIKIIHMADMHLGRKFASLSNEKANIRRRELLETFEQILLTAKTQQIDALLIAGDLFDSNDDALLISAVREKFAQLEEINIFIAAGNHDWNAYSNEKWSANVHVFGTELEKVTIGDADIYGASFANIHQEQSLLKKIDCSENNASILVMHGNLVGKDANPLDKDLLRQFDYAALGHIHAYSGIIRQGPSAYAYAGFPEPTGFDDEGRGGILLGRVGKGTADLERIQTTKREYCHIEANITDCIDNLDIAELIRGRIEADNLYRVVLRGNPNNFSLSLEYIASCLKNFCFDLSISQQKSVDYSRLANDYSLKGMFVKRMLQLIETAPEKEKYVRALEIGLEAMEKNEVVSNAETNLY